MSDDDEQWKTDQEYLREAKDRPEFTRRLNEVVTAMRTEAASDEEEEEK